MTKGDSKQRVHVNLRIDGTCTVVLRSKPLAECNLLFTVFFFIVDKKIESFTSRETEETKKKIEG